MPETTLEDVLAEQRDLPVPLTGQLVDLSAAAEVAIAIDDVRQAEQQLAEARRFLTDVLALHAARQGTKTLHLGHVDVELSGGTKTEYDTEQLTHGLRSAGLPEERLTEAVKEIVTYKVDQRVVNQLASANPAYREVIEKAKRIVSVPWRARVERTHAAG